MTDYALQNNVLVRLANDVGSTDTTITVEGVNGPYAVAPYELPPAPGGSQLGIVTITDSLDPLSASKIETLTYSGYADNGSTIDLQGAARGVENTTAFSWFAGDFVYQGLTLDVKNSLGGGGGGGARLGFAARGSSDSLSAASWSPVTFNSEIEDTDANFDGSAFVAPSAGMYEVNATLVFTSVNDGEKFIVGAVVNSNTSNVYIIGRGVAGGTGYAGTGGSVKMYLSSFDIVKIYAWVGNSTTLASTQNYNTFSIYKLPE